MSAFHELFSAARASAACSPAGLVIFFNAMVQLIIIKSPDYRFLASNGGNLAGDSLYLLPGALLLARLRSSGR